MKALGFEGCEIWRLTGFSANIGLSAYLAFGVEDIRVDPHAVEGRYGHPACSDSAILAGVVGSVVDIALPLFDGLRSRPASTSLKGHISFHRNFTKEKVSRSKHVYAVTEFCRAQGAGLNLYAIVQGRQLPTRSPSLRPGALCFPTVFADPPFLHHEYPQPLPTFLSANPPLSWPPLPPPQPQMSFYS